MDTGHAGHQTVGSDANIALTPLASAEEQRHTGTLTANRTITLSTSNAYLARASASPAQAAARLR